jgi:hypothetical protein
MKRSIAVVALVVTAALALVATAAADQPTTTITHFDRTRTIAAGPDACAFPILVHSVGDFRETVYSSGKDSTWAVDFHISWSNPVNGKTITSVLGGPFVVVPNGDGTVTVTINGNDALFTGPGLGVLFAQVGLVVYIADPSDVFTPLTIVMSTGQQDTSFFPAVCAALA